MARIVTTDYRYKRPPRKRQAAAIVGPAVVKTGWPGAKDVPEMAPEEHRRRGDAAQALFRKVTKTSAGPARSPRSR